ncbi:unnamed protein product [Lactuca saligna]|uniref:Uncharacterized protein n=1 Tax=Lactuca saligna TaxID=75948 RepID=A0AA36E4S8_LACSI|nr:unnamed protein product [Lactuca saligna]
MAIANTVVDHFNTIEDEVFVHNMNDSILAHTLTNSFSIIMKWLSIPGSMAIYNKTMKIVTFKMELKGDKRLNKKQFAQILQLSSEGSFEVPMNDQVLQVFNWSHVFKTKLAPIPDLNLRLPTNAPRLSTYVSQRGDEGVVHRKIVEKIKEK